MSHPFRHSGSNRHYYHQQRHWSGLGGSFFSYASAFAGIFLLISFLSLCVAAGLFYLAELTEEYTQMTRKCLKLLIKSLLVIHVFVLLVDRLPFWCVLCGLAAHLLYLQLMKSFPYVDFLSLEFIGSVGLGVSSNLLWFWFFWKNPRCAYVSLEFVTGFMVLLAWLVPFSFLVSLTTTAQALPIGNGVEFASRGKRMTAISSLFAFVRNKRDQVLPTTLMAQNSLRR